MKELILNISHINVCSPSLIKGRKVNQTCTKKNPKSNGPSARDKILKSSLKLDTDRGDKDSLCCMINPSKKIFGVE